MSKSNPGRKTVRQVDCNAGMVPGAPSRLSNYCFGDKFEEIKNTDLRFMTDSREPFFTSMDRCRTHRTKSR
jgi:hypothetical protein